MNLFRDKKIIILTIILTLFSVCYFVIANKISYAFSNQYDIESAYQNIINTIKECAIAYGEKNPDLFEEETIYIKVQDLIDNNLLIANSDGDILNPLKKNEILNYKIIKIKKEKDKISVEVDS